MSRHTQLDCARSLMMPVRAVQDGTDLSFRHPHHTSSGRPEDLATVSLYELDECSARLKRAHFARQSAAFASNYTRVSWSPEDWFSRRLAIGRGLPCATKVFRLQERSFCRWTCPCPLDDGQAFPLSVDALNDLHVTTRSLGSALHGVVTLTSVRKAFCSAKSNPLPMSPLSQAESTVSQCTSWCSDIV